MPCTLFLMQPSLLAQTHFLPPPHFLAKKKGGLKLRVPLKKKKRGSSQMASSKPQLIGASGSSGLATLHQFLCCPICDEVMRMPVVSSTCSHIFCEACINNAIENGVEVWVRKAKAKKSAKRNDSSCREEAGETRRGFHIKPRADEIADYRKKHLRFSCPLCMLPAFKWMLRPVPVLADCIVAYNNAREKACASTVHVTIITASSGSPVEQPPQHGMSLPTFISNNNSNNIGDSVQPIASSSSLSKLSGRGDSTFAAMSTAPALTAQQLLQQQQQQNESAVHNTNTKRPRGEDNLEDVPRQEQQHDDTDTECDVIPARHGNKHVGIATGKSLTSTMDDSDTTTQDVQLWNPTAAPILPTSAHADATATSRRRGGGSPLQRAQIAGDDTRSTVDQNGSSAVLPMVASGVTNTGFGAFHSSTAAYDRKRRDSQASASSLDCTPNDHHPDRRPSINVSGRILGASASAVRASVADSRHTEVGTTASAPVDATSHNNQQQVQQQDVSNRTITILCDASLSASACEAVETACKKLGGKLAPNFLCPPRCASPAANACFEFFDPVCRDLFSSTQQEELDSQKFGVDDLHFSHVVCDLQKPSLQLKQLSVQACSAVTASPSVNGTWIVDVNWVRKSLALSSWAAEAIFECAGTATTHGCFSLARGISKSRFHEHAAAISTNSNISGGTEKHVGCSVLANNCPWIKDAAFLFTHGAVQEAGGLLELRRLIAPSGGRLLNDIIDELSRTIVARRSQCVLPQSIFVIYSSTAVSFTERVLADTDAIAALQRVGFTAAPDDVDRAARRGGVHRLNSSAASTSEKRKVLQDVCESELNIATHAAMDALRTLVSLVCVDDSVCCRCLDWMLGKIVTMAQTVA